MLNHPLSLGPWKARLQMPAHLRAARFCAPLTCCIFALFILLCSEPSLFAQTAGRITGVVTDTTGAVISGAKIVLTNQSTGVARATVSTGSGDYTFTFVAPGQYTLQASHAGFNSATSNVQLQMQQTLSLNFALKVGEVTQSVEVQATGALLQTDNPTLGTVIGNQSVTQLPLNGRDYLSLVNLSANAQTLANPGDSSGGGTSREGGPRALESISVGGQRIFFDRYTLDGINNTDVDFNTFVIQPTIDAIDQFKVQDGIYPAEYGYNATQVNVATQSGGNQYHGALFYFLRNNYADAEPYNFTPTPEVVYPYKYNDYGFVLDGPVTIPKVFNGKNRLFFMASDEWFSQVEYNEGLSTMPTQAVLNGDFSDFTLTNGGPVIPIYDPATGNPDGTGKSQFSCGNKLNVICPDRIDPISANIIKLYMHPNTTGSFLNNYTYTTTARDSHNGFTLRLDFDQSPKLQWMFRFSNGNEPVSSTGFPALGGTVGQSVATNFSQYEGQMTWIISPTVVNVLRAGRTNFFNSLGLYSAYVDDDIAKLNIPNLVPGSPASWGIPDFSWSPDPYTSIGDASDGPYVTSDPDTSVNDTLTLVKGKHSIDLGFEYDRQLFDEAGNQFTRGTFAYQANATADVVTAGSVVKDTGSGFADFLLGDVYSTEFIPNGLLATAYFNRNVEAAFFDDAYKLTPKITLSAGLRYELTPPWYNTLNNEFAVDLNNSPQNGAPQEPESEWPYFVRQGNCENPYQGVPVRWVEADGVTPVTPAPQCANGSYSNDLMETDYTNFAPRIGLAWSPTPTLVVRTGFGIFYDHDIANPRFDMQRNSSGKITFQNGSLAGDEPFGVPYTNYQNALTGTVNGLAYIKPPYAYAYAYNHATSRTDEYLLNLQKQVGQNWAFELGYLGNFSRNLYGLRDANWVIPYGYVGDGALTPEIDRTPFPNYGTIQEVMDWGIGNYNALSLKVTRRYSNGLNIIASYTYGKSLDDTSGIRPQEGLVPQNPDCAMCEYGPSDFDVRNRLVTSVMYDLPIGAGKLWAPRSKLVDAAIGGWQISTIGTIQDGEHQSLSVTGNLTNTDQTSERPNVNPGVSVSAGRSLAHWYNPAAFSTPPGGFLGDMQRNGVTGPGVDDWDTALHKDFNMPYNEHQQLQIRFEVFNTFNHPNFGTPSGATQNVPATFGEITTMNNAINNGLQRELQLAAKYVF